MITNLAVSAVLATGTALVYDLVTLTINRGRCHQFNGSGVFLQTKEILDSVRWTNAPRSLRANVAEGLQVFLPVAGVAYQRDTLGSKAGAEVLQVGFAVAGIMPVYLSTAQDGSGSFPTTLAELALLGLLDGATLTIDQVVCSDLPATPVSAGAAYGIVSPDPVRVFSGILRGAKPTGDAVTFDACDPLILGGGSVPRNLYSPLCRWEFAGGQVGGIGCPVPLELGGSGPVFRIDTGAYPITFPDAQTVDFGSVGWTYMPWCFLVPQDGPMMGMRFQVGSKRSGNQYDFADRLPWTWSCSVVHLEASCSKAWPARQSNALNTEAEGCTGWNVSYSTLDSFGGHPDMPQPESA